MNTSYRTHAARRACLSRAPAPTAARGTGAKRPLELPPWGYGSCRAALSTTPPSVDDARRTSRSRTRSTSSAKQTNSCHDSAAAAASVRTQLSHWSSSTTHGHVGDEFGDVVEPKNASSATAQNAVVGTSAAAAAGGLPSERPCGLRATGIGERMLTGGGRAVTSSSMETWTTYESTSPRVQSTVSSPHSDASPQLTSTVNTPLSPPQSVNTPLGPPQLVNTRLSPPRSTISPTALTTTDALRGELLAADLADAARTPVKPASPSSDVAGSQKSTTPTSQPTTNDALTVTAHDVAATPVCSDEQRRVAANGSTGQVAVDKPANLGSGSDSNREAPRRVASKTDPAAKNRASTSESNDDGLSSLMVGLVKIKSRHTGLMIDCPILEMTQQSDVPESPTAAVRRSSSHKVVLIKAVVPRRVWNGRGKFTPPPASVTSTRSSDRASVDVKATSTSVAVSVNTQTSETLLPPARRTASEQRTAPPSPTTCKHDPALEDDRQLMPSPKLSACSARAKSSPTTPAHSRHNIQTPQLKCRAPSSPNNTTAQSSARAENKNLIPAETSNLPTPPSSYGKMPVMSEKPKELESMARRSMDDDSLMGDTLESLKLDLQFSSDSDSAMYGKTVGEHVNRSSSSSSSSCDEVRCDRQASSCQPLPTINWSCAAAPATASSDAVESFKASSYIDKMAVRVEPSSSSRRQTPRSAGRSPHTAPLQRRAPDGRKPRADDATRRRNSCQSSANGSPKNSADARLERSTCLWRSSVSNDGEVDGWPGCDLSCHDQARYERQQHCLQSPPSQKHVSSTVAYALRPESSLSDGSKSVVRDYYEVPTMNTSHAMPPRSPHNQAQWVAVVDHEVTSGASDTCATGPLDACAAHRRPDNFRSDTADDVESATRLSRQKHRRPTPVNKHRAAEPKSPRKQRHSRPAERADDRRRRSTEATRRGGELAQSSQSTGSVTVARNARTSKRQRSLPASRHPPRNSGTDGRRVEHSDRRASSSRVPQRSTEPRQRRHHGQQNSASATQYTPSRRGSRPANASTSKSADSMPRHHGRPPFVQTNYSASVAKQSHASQPKHSVSGQPPRRRDEREAPATFYECRQPVVYCSPRSLKPFPPPVSDRRPPPPSVDSSPAATVGTSLDGESFQCEFVERRDESEYGDDQPGDSSSPPPRRLYRPPRTDADHHRRRANTATVGDNGGRRRNKRSPATPVSDGRTWRAVSAGVALPSVIERPAWKQY